MLGKENSVEYYNGDWILIRKDIVSHNTYRILELEEEFLDQKN